MDASAVAAQPARITAKTRSLALYVFFPTQRITERPRQVRGIQCFQDAVAGILHNISNSARLQR